MNFALIIDKNATFLRKEACLSRFLSILWQKVLLTKKRLTV